MKQWHDVMLYMRHVTYQFCGGYPSIRYLSLLLRYLFETCRRATCTQGSLYQYLQYTSLMKNDKVVTAGDLSQVCYLTMTILFNRLHWFNHWPTNFHSLIRCLSNICLPIITFSDCKKKAALYIVELDDQAWPLCLTQSLPWEAIHTDTVDIGQWPVRTYVSTTCIVSLPWESISIGRTYLLSQWNDWDSRCGQDQSIVTDTCHSLVKSYCCFGRALATTCHRPLTGHECSSKNNAMLANLHSDVVVISPPTIWWWYVWVRKRAWRTQKLYQQIKSHMVLTTRKVSCQLK